MSQESMPEDGRIRSSVHEYLLAEFLPGENPAALTNETPLITGGVLDSIGSVKLVSHLEETYGVRFEAYEMTVDRLDTIDRIVATVQEKLTG